MKYITQKRVKEIVKKVEEKINFRCKKHTEREDCNKCPDKNTCQSKKITWTCKHNFTLFVESLGELKATTKEIIGATMFITQHGGWCDCEIVFNAKPHLQQKTKKKSE